MQPAAARSRRRRSPSVWHMTPRYVRHACMHAPIHARTHARTRALTYAYMHAHMRALARAHTHVGGPAVRWERSRRGGLCPVHPCVFIEGTHTCVCMRICVRTHAHINILGDSRQDNGMPNATAVLTVFGRAPTGAQGRSFNAAEARMLSILAKHGAQMLKHCAQAHTTRTHAHTRASARMHTPMLSARMHVYAQAAYRCNASCCDRAAGRRTCGVRCCDQAVCAAHAGGSFAGILDWHDSQEGVLQAYQTGMIARREFCRHTRLA